MAEHKKGVVPRLRFPEFRDTGPWEVERLGEIFVGSRVPSNHSDPTRRITVRLHLQGVEHREYRGTEVENATSFFVRSAGQFIYGKQNFHKGAFGIIPTELHGFESSSDIPAFDFTGHVVPQFVFYYLSRTHCYPLFEKKMTGTGSKRLHSETFLKSKIYIPSNPEQQKIADCLSSLDELIQLQTQKLNALKAHKKGLMQQLFPSEGETIPRLRFPEFRDTGPWEVKRLGDLLNYERPEKYIVQSGNYGSNGIPVLTANKSFILGYTLEQNGIYNDVPAIIFDDFTTDKKFVDFPFKVKSSAIKILKQKGKNSLRFLFELMNLIRFDPQQHKRYYISEYQNIAIRVPRPEEQNKIADCLSSHDQLIELQAQKLDVLRAHKKGLMQQLFPQEVE